MRFLLLNPAPDDVDDQVYWGDTFFGNALVRCLTAHDCEVTTRFWPNWDGPCEADVLLVLRGIRPVTEVPGDFSQRVIWIISHPEDVTDEELSHFDLVLCGSESHSKALRNRGFNAHAFLQCTDETIFFPKDRKSAAFENQFVFVGNARSERMLIHEAIAADFPLKIWGRGWKQADYDRCVVAPFIHNRDLGALYRTSYCTLNDHWKDMARFDYVNNRVFDALACGLPVLSDPHVGLDSLNFGGIKIKRPDQSVHEAVDELVVDYDRHQEAAIADSRKILTEHTFTVRANQLLALIEKNS